MTEAVESFSISDLAKEFEVTTRAIRHYEELELLKPARNGQSRVYSRGDRTRLKLILRGKRLGFTLQESRDIIQLYNPEQQNRQQQEQLLALVQQQQARLQAQLKDIQTMQKELGNVEAECRKFLKRK